MLGIYFTSINSKTNYTNLIISIHNFGIASIFFNNVIFSPQKFKMPKTFDQRTESNPHLCARSLPGDGVCHSSP